MKGATWGCACDGGVGCIGGVSLQIMFYSLNLYIGVYNLKVSDAGGSMIIHSKCCRRRGALVVGRGRRRVSVVAYSIEKATTS